MQALLLVIGGFMGMIVFEVPAIWVSKVKGGYLDMESFSDTFPKKMVVYYLYKLSPLIWLFLYFVLIPLIIPFSPSITFFSGYLLLGGFAVLEGLLEISTGVSPIRGGRGAFRLKSFLVDDYVKHIGAFRVGIFMGIGFLSWIILS